MKLKEILGDKRGMAATLGNIGLVYEDHGQAGRGAISCSTDRSE